jgi:hypothetical protein
MSGYERSIFAEAFPIAGATATAVIRPVITPKQRLMRAIERNDMATVRAMVQADASLLLNITDGTPCENWLHAFEFAEKALRYSAVSEEIIQYLRENTPANYETLRDEPSWRVGMRVANATRHQYTAQDAVNVFTM